MKVNLYFSCIAILSLIIPLSCMDSTLIKVEENFTEDSIVFTSNNWSYQLEMGTGSLYQITITIDEIDHTYKINCHIRSPPNLTVNGYSWSFSKYLIIHDGDSITFKMSSNIHISDAEISLVFNSRDSPKNFPKGGFTGNILIQEINSGIKDHSFYRSQVKLTPNETFFILHYPGDGLAFKDTFGNEAVVKMVVTLNDTSISDLKIESIDGFDSKTNFSTMIIPQGTVREQIFEFYDEMHDVVGDYTFNVTLEDVSGHTEGKLAMYLIQEGKIPRDPIVYYIFNLIGILFFFLIFLPLTLGIFFFWKQKK